MGEHDSAIKHHNEMLFLHKHCNKFMNQGEQKRFWSAVRKELEIDMKIHELYIVVKDRVERVSGK